MKTRDIVFYCLLFSMSFLSCHKTDYKRDERDLRKWIHQNGGIYKNEVISILIGNNEVISGKLEWQFVSEYSINNIHYTEIPFSFNGAKEAHAGGFTSSFDFVIRRKDTQIEGSIKITQKGAFPISRDEYKAGRIENYYTINNQWINSWFIDPQNSNIFRGASQPVQNGLRVSVNGKGERTENNSSIYCYSFSTPSYEVHCSPTDPVNPSYDQTCVWSIVGYGVVVFCFDNSGGGGGEIGGPWPPSSGTSGSQQQNPGVPCPGDVVKNPRIARSNPTNINGGRFGPTRRNQDGSPKMHKGLDIYALPGTAIYAAYAGVVTRSVSSYAPTFYGGPTSFGNLVEIESTLPNGETIRTLYGHLNTTPLLVGEYVQQGQEIGMSGRTGNAQKGYSPHVHVQITQNGQKKNPENYLSTKFDAAGTPIYIPCN